MEGIEASQPPVPEGLYWRFGDRVFPRQAGGEIDQAAADTGADQGDSTEIQGDTDQSADQASDAGLEAPFSLSDVSEEIRPDVERYVKQTQAAFTRKSMELAEQRREAAAMLDLDSRLADESTRQEALQELLGRYDLELELDDEDGDYQRPDELEQFEDVADDDLPPWAKALIERDKQRDADETAKAQADTESKLRSHVTGALDAYKAEAFPNDEALPAEQNDALLGLGMVLPPRTDGLPDMEAAVTMLGAIEAAAVQRFIDSKRAAPPPATRRGTSGADKPDLSNQDERLAQANKVAARHLDQ